MRKIMLLFGLLLLLAGVVSEALYITTNKVAYNGVVSDSYLVTGMIFIVVGFILTLSSVKIPKIRVP